VIDLPDYTKIKQMEKLSQKDGCGLGYEELLGLWKLKHLWKKNSDEIDNISSTFLQVFSASLELTKKDEKSLKFEIKNSVKFGLFELIFLGIASLKGSRPLLTFYFKTFKINIGNYSLIKKSLKKPVDKQMPFFSLIGISDDQNWMCARGRGGGLAIWIKS